MTPFVCVPLRHAPAACWDQWADWSCSIWAVSWGSSSVALRSPSPSSGVTPGGPSVIGSRRESAVTVLWPPFEVFSAWPWTQFVPLACLRHSVCLENTSAKTLHARRQTTGSGRSDLSPSDGIFQPTDTFFPPCNPMPQQDVLQVLELWERLSEEILSYTLAEAVV